MSKTTKRKHVTREVLDDYYVPEGDEEIAKIVGGRGNNLHEVENVNGKKFLVSMPTKFRKNLWIKRGDFVVISPIKEGNKVLAEIASVLYPKQIKYLQDEKLWPDVFTEKSTNKSGMNESEEQERVENFSNSSEDEDELLFRNPNRKEFIHVEESETDSSDDESQDEDDSIIHGYVEDSEVNDVELTAQTQNILKIT